VSNRIDRCFASARDAGRKVLVPFMTAGDPHPDWTVSLMHSLADAGADLLELGVPFSDPMADGPVIQAASERAISRGMNLHGVLKCVAEFRTTNSACPVVLMGYMNPVERFGFEALTEAAAAAGVDGLLLVDCPPEEMAELHTSMRDQGVYAIRLVAPTTTPDRVASITRQAEGFVYYVSFKGITGAQRLDAEALRNPLAQIRACTDLPVAVGFGIKDARSAVAVARFADGVVVGSALVEALADAGSADEACRRAGGFVASLREALDNS
jgi:tryptophan synthase alpha chain